MAQNAIQHAASPADRGYGGHRVCGEDGGRDNTHSGAESGDHGGLVGEPVHVEVDHVGKQLINRRERPITRHIPPLTRCPDEHPLLPP